MLIISKPEVFEREGVIQLSTGRGATPLFDFTTNRYLLHYKQTYRFLDFIFEINLISSSLYIVNNTMMLFWRTSSNSLEFVLATRTKAHTVVH